MTLDDAASRAGLPRCLVVMGVSGSGKTTVGEGLAARLGLRFADGDDFHPAANLIKMRSGKPLTDEDRRPWLDALVGWIDEQAAGGCSAVLACSALRRRYRDRLCGARAQPFFCHVTAPEVVLADRLARRSGHWMPPGLLASQLATLEPLEHDESGVEVDGTGTPEEIIARALRSLPELPASGGPAATAPRSGRRDGRTSDSRRG